MHLVGCLRRRTGDAGHTNIKFNDNRF